MLDRVGSYDLLLVAISLPMVAASVAAAVVGVPAALLLGAGSLPAGGLVGYALFVDPPDVER